MACQTVVKVVEYGCEGANMVSNKNHVEASRNTVLLESGMFSIEQGVAQVIIVNVCGSAHCCGCVSGNVGLTVL